MGMIYDIFPFKDFNPSLIPRLLENFRRIQHAFNFLQSRYFQKEPVWDAKQDAIHQGPTPPENPTEGTFWLDTSQQPNVLYRYEGGQWVKVTPTEPEEIGAEPRIARGSTPPSNPKTDDIWIDTSTRPPVWKRWNGSDWEKMTRTDLAELYGKITGEQIGDYVIVPRHIAWLDAGLITTGTMLFNRVRGGTAELGGYGNTSGLLLVRDASGLERVRLDNTGVSVFEGYFSLKDAQTQVPSSIVPTTNLVRDHSFETVPRTGSPDAYKTYQVDTTNMGDLFWWHFSGSTAARVLSAYDEAPSKIAKFDFQAAVLRYWQQTMWKQKVPIDSEVGTAGPYTLSAWFAAYGATTTDTTAVGELWALDANFSTIGNVGSFTVPIKASEKLVWKRGYKTVYNLPSNTAYLEIRLYCTPDTYILCDGVQLVPLAIPAVYDPESALWRAIRELPGYRRAEQLPRVRLTRTSNFSVSTSTPTALPWQARRSGYTTADFWNPQQGDTTIVRIPETGIYIVSVNVRWQASAYGYRTVAIQKNGSINIAKEQIAASPSGDTYQEVTQPHLFNKGDYIKVVVLHNNASALSIVKEEEVSPELTIARIF